jgi:hypothetical protein
MRISIVTDCDCCDERCVMSNRSFLNLIHPFWGRRGIRTFPGYMIFRSVRISRWLGPKSSHRSAYSTGSSGSIFSLWPTAKQQKVMLMCLLLVQQSEKQVLSFSWSFLFCLGVRSRYQFRESLYDGSIKSWEPQLWNLYGWVQKPWIHDRDFMINRSITAVLPKSLDGTISECEKDLMTL